MKKKLLITGGSGFLGVNLALKLKKKYEIFLGSRNNKLNHEAKAITGCEVLPLDVSSSNSLRDAMNYVQPEVVIHAAATKFVDLSEKFPLECIDTNVNGSANVVRECLNFKVGKVIGISTDKASPPIKNTYGLSKSIMERLFVSSNSKKTKFTCVRYGNVAWSTKSVLPIWKEMFIKNKKIISTGPEMRRFFFTIYDAVSLVEYSLKNINRFQGKILSREMKAAQVKQLLEAWIDIYGGSYEFSSERPGERIDEYLIGQEELRYSETFNENGIKYFLINFNKKSKKPLKNIVSSMNAKNLNKNEIKSLIKTGFENN